MGDVHRPDGGERFEGSILRERHAHALERFVHEDLELMLAASERDHELPRAHGRGEVRIDHHLGLTAWD